MTVTIYLPDDQATALQAKAAAAGLSLEAWFQKLADAELPVAAGSLQAAADLVLKEMRNVPAEAMAGMPEDGASEHDHYLYGWPKKDA
jgi:hypothetical protein